MTDATDALIAAFRDYVTDGIPATGLNDPSKAEIRTALSSLAMELDALTVGAKPYATLSALTADTAYAVAGHQARVYADGTPANNGYYIYKSGAWSIDSDFYNAVAAVVQPLVDSAAASAAAAATSAALFQHYLIWKGAKTRSPFFVDSNGSELWGADSAPSDGVSYYRGHFVDWLRALPLSSSVLTSTFGGFTNLYLWKGSVTRAPLWMDSREQLLLGANSSPADGVSLYEGHFHDYILTRATSAAYVPTALAAADRPVIRDYNGINSGGQSLGLGAMGRPVLTASQFYSNKTHAGGTKSYDSSHGLSGTFRALYEDTAQEQGGTSDDRGESLCTAMANHACKLYARDGGNPNSLVFCVSISALGGTKIADLSKPSTTYTRLRNQIKDFANAAVALGKTFAFHAVVWTQGESDITAGTTQSAYVAALKQLIDDINTDVLADINTILTAAGKPTQTAPIHMLLNQTAYKRAVSPQIALAQFQAVQEHRLIHFVTDYSFIPYNTDHLHSTNVGYNWLGHYVGRAAYQLIVNGNVPDCIWPLGATVNSGGTEITLRFRTPSRIKLNGPVQTDYGIKVTDGTGTLTLSNIRVTDYNEIRFSINRTLGTSPVIRVGLDYQAVANIDSGALSDITDSTTDACVINGTTYSLVHRAPAFQISINTVEA